MGHGQCARAAGDRADERHAAALAQHERDHLTCGRTKREPHAELAPPLRDGIRGDAVRADAGKEQRGPGEHRRQHQREGAHGLRVARVRRQRAHIVDGQRRIELVHQTPHRGNQIAGIRRGPNRIGHRIALRLFRRKIHLLAKIARDLAVPDVTNESDDRDGDVRAARRAGIGLQALAEGALARPETIRELRIDNRDGL